MKKAILFSLVLISATVFAQDSSYNDKVKFNMGDSVENGITFQRKATFEAMIYNQRVKSIALQFSVEFWNTAGTKKMGLVKPYTREVIIPNNEYVITATGVVIGSLDSTLRRFGTKADSVNYLKRADGNYVTSVPVSTHYDYMVKTFDNTTKLHTTIKNAGQKAAAEGKLN